jgi:endonuclease-3
LFTRATTPKQLLALSESDIAKLIYPVGFYRTKARQLRATSRILLEKFDGNVPDDIDTLVTLPGVGRKTANLVVIQGHGKPGMCVDTHVHRISNRWGYVTTTTPEKTETALRGLLPKKHWMEYNDLLVSFGQHRCAPVSPRCSDCPVRKYCPRIGVTKSR